MAVAGRTFYSSLLIRTDKCTLKLLLDFEVVMAWSGLPRKIGKHRPTFGG